jgi:acetyl-CoA C-acetyltransferase
MTDAYIYDAIRTPRGRGRKDGALHEVTSLSLAGQVLQAMRDRNGLDTALIDDVILGVVAPVGEQGADIARIAILASGYADSVAGLQINRYCASGLEACNIAAAKIISGESDLVIAGGVESMSRVPMAADGGAFAVDPSVAFPNYLVGQGVAADLLATLMGFTREDVDAYAVESQRRAALAWAENRFGKSIIPVRDQIGLPLLTRDEHMRPATSMQTLAALQPAFAKTGALAFDAVAIQRYPELERIDHVHHAGNSSGIVDGAAGVLLGSKEMGVALGLKPRARMRAMASIGSEPSIMLTGPSLATRKVLKKAGMATVDIDLYELNEAFAAVVLCMMQALDLPHHKMNVNGGAIAMGHPLGATGTMILGTALDELERQGKETALITLCVGLGMSTATIIERV